MLKLFKITLTIILLSITYSLLSTKVHALTYTYPEYNVEIKINQDSTFDVKETAIYQFYGETHGLRRDLTLNDPTRNCTGDLTCGGFDRVEVLSVKDNLGNDLTGKYTTYEVNEGKRAFRFEWEIWEDGEFLNGETLGWTIEYRIYGGIKKIGTNPYFYWNVLPENRGGTVERSTIKIQFPKNIKILSENLKFYDTFKNYIITPDNVITINELRLPSYSNYTVSYKFNPDEITLPGNITYKFLTPDLGNEVYLDGVKIDDMYFGNITAVPAGNHKIEFKHFGYKTVEKILNLKPGETLDYQITLEPESWMQLLLMLNILLCISGFALIPMAIIFVFFHYRNKGRDKEMPKTIIPLYEPPVGVAPYLLGTLKDESVDKEDVVGSIIDLAYRGYIKIKELSKPSLFNSNGNYLLTKLEGKKDDPGLKPIENDILDAVFDGNDEIETNDMRNHFPLKYYSIVNKIYKELVEKGYFSRQPKTTIGMYVGMGILLMMLGGFSGVCFSIFASPFLGYISIFMPGFALALLGFGLILIANFMPAKTAEGSRIFAEILGFKMYLNTAERYRLQNLGPEEFEKYLSYAIVFKIEKEWAKKFEGIYNKIPDWYEGSGSAYDALWISSFTRSFANSTITSMTPVSSSSGSGWSGSSGSFGGFSGGGGGGGSSGAW